MGGNLVGVCLLYSICFHVSGVIIGGKVVLALAWCLALALALPLGLEITVRREGGVSLYIHLHLDMLLSATGFENYTFLYFLFEVNICNLLPLAVGPDHILAGSDCGALMGLGVRRASQD